MTRPSDRVVEIGRALVAELHAESPLYRAILEGEVSLEAYVEWLVQHHKYARVSYEMMRRYAEAMGRSERRTYRTVIHSGAKNHAEEEKGHDDGILADLAVLWQCHPGEALARIEATPTAPAVSLYLASVASALEKFPAAIAGLACVLECISTEMAAAARDALREKRPFPRIERALKWLSDHSEDGDHVEGGRIRIDLVEGDHETSALWVLSRTTAIYYREMFRYMDAVFAGRVRARELAAV